MKKRNRFPDWPALCMLDRRRDERAAFGLPEDRNIMWEAIIAIHNNRACSICGISAIHGRWAGPAPDPSHTRM